MMPNFVNLVPYTICLCVISMRSVVFMQAFRVAENELGIPRHIKVVDMVSNAIPDKLAVITYVSQLHSYFNDLPKSGERK